MRQRLWWLLPTLLAAALAAVAMAPVGVGAAPLTGGNTIYVIEGEDVIFTFDPVALRDGMLLPVEVFQRVGLLVQVEGRQVAVSRDQLAASLTLGLPVVEVDRRQVVLRPAPLRLSGRLFLPAGLLTEFGFDLVAEQGYLAIRDLARDLPEPAGTTAEAYQDLLRRHSLETPLRSDARDSYLSARVTYLSPDLVSNTRFPATFGQRARLLHLMEYHTLIMVDATNDWLRAVTLSPGSIMLVDPAGNQYDFTGEMVPLTGDIGTPIAPGAHKISVLIYPRVPLAAGRVQVYSDTTGQVVGDLPVGR